MPEHSPQEAMARVKRTLLVLVLGLPWAASSAAGQEVGRDPHGLFAADSLSRLFDGGFFTEGPALGPDGHLYFWLMDADGTNRLQLTDDPADDYWPSWSSDGTRISFTSSRTGSSDVFVMNSDGSGESNLTVSPSTSDVAGFPQGWSP